MCVQGKGYVLDVLISVSFHILVFLVSFISDISSMKMETSETIVDKDIL